VRFLWFGKKKKVRVSEPEITPELTEVFSVTNFVLVNNPIPATTSTYLTDQSINSIVLSVLTEEHSPSAVAAQEFFQERGANLLPLRDFASYPTRGLSARVKEGDLDRTVLIGPAEVIALATTPFCAEITEASRTDPDGVIVAIDGIAYVSYTVTSEMV
jgi:hypothetical protein